MNVKRLTALVLTGAVTASMALTGCGKSIDSDATAATLDGTKITYETANFIAQYTAATYDQYYLSYFGENMWTTDLNSSGSTFEEDTKESLLDQIEEYYLMKEHMDDYKVTLTDEETSAIAAAAKQFMEDNSTASQNAMGATEAAVTELLTLRTIQTKMRAAIIADVDTTVSDDEAAQKTISYVAVSKTATSTATDDTTATDTAATDTSTDSATDDAAAKAKTTATAILEAAQSGTLEDAADANSATVSTASYGESDLSKDDNSTSLDVSVLKAADKLKEGAVATELVETDDNYYIVRMDSEFDQSATDKKKETIVSDRQDDKYNEVLDAYKKDAKWTVEDDVWSQVDLEGLYKITTNESTATDTAADTAATATDTAADTTANTTDTAATTAK